MADFAAATMVAGGDGHYRARLDADWFAWGPFGGYLAALALRALGAEARLPWPATFSGLFLNVGEPGDVDIEVRTLRGGKRAEALRAMVVQGDRPLFEASVWLIDVGLAGLTHNHARMPAVPPPERVQSYRELANNYDEWFPFWRHIEGRPMQWYEPDSRPAPDPVWQCWLRLNQPALPDGPVMRAAAAVMWLDFPGWNAAVHAHPWPPTHIAPTLDLTVQFRASLYESAAPPAWFLAEGVCPTGAGGLLGAMSHLWAPDGTLLAASTTQMMCRTNPQYEQELAEMARRRSDDQKANPERSPRSS
jgi:acyl-CoA thioesterase